MKKVIIACLAGLALSGCVSKAPMAPVAPQRPAVAIRDANAPIWSIAQFTPARLAGEWRQVAGFGAAGCKGGAVQFHPVGGQLQAKGSLCFAGRQQVISSAVQPVGPGRLRIDGREWWVVWVDTDYRTLAIGTPDGSFGFLLNRGGALPADRMRAASDVFDFNGYRVSQMVRY